MIIITLKHIRYHDHLFNSLLMILDTSVKMTTLCHLRSTTCLLSAHAIFDFRRKNESSN